MCGGLVGSRWWNRWVGSSSVQCPCCWQWGRRHVTWRGRQVLQLSAAASFWTMSTASPAQCRYSFIVYAGRWRQHQPLRHCQQVVRSRQVRAAERRGTVASEAAFISGRRRRLSRGRRSGGHYIRSIPWIHPQTVISDLTVSTSRLRLKIGLNLLCTVVAFWSDAWLSNSCDSSLLQWVT